ncbi:hypothetical protein A9Q99_00005 [Gammaproteobacteria bacterium 45_16_T64]|nr:hypothetical protein A9Q99_00005 [Gammaproteobacteria bacterium 45_16_T64]
MRLFTYLALAFLLLINSGCDAPSPSSTGQPEKDSLASTGVLQEYIETGDLTQIQDRGILRLIAPRFDGADALPREGISVAGYQRTAEAFAKQLQLDVQWVFVDEFSELIPSLQRGEGDLIITNLTITESRLDKVLFSQPIKKVNEVLISRSKHPISKIEDLASFSVTIPEGTAYIETLARAEKKHNITLNVNKAPSSTSDSELLSLIQQNNFDATILDSDVANILMRDHPELAAQFILRKNRPIAWAGRKTSPALIQKLNEFLVSHHLRESSLELASRNWEQIKESGRLRMLTLNNPASYFMWRGELMGFDKDLIEQFAKNHGLHLSVIIKDSIPELIASLNAGEGDVIAASLTQSSKREEQGLMFSKPYLTIRESIVGKTNGPEISSPEELKNHTVGVNPDTTFYDYFEDLKLSGVDLISKEYKATSTETLFAKLINEEFDFVMTDSHLLAIEMAYRENLKVAFTLDDPAFIAWGLRKNQPELMAKLNQFIKKEYRGLFYNITFNKYFKNSRRMKKHKKSRIFTGGRLSPYDELVKETATKYAMDWRLVISQMYQESKFNPNAKSFAGAQGLMQVMPRTAKELGISNIHIPENGINAGLAYMHWLKGRFPGDLDFEERIYFTLAAYNAGAGHVRDARKLATQLGLDPKRWFGHVEKAMLLLAQPKYYKKARFGYVRGAEPVHYVKSIRARYLGYLNTQS